jgi:copper chaperone NosL
LLACLGLAACGPSAGPEPIVYDREACAHCRMLISDPHFAAQLRTADGFALSFDDPGCLLAFLAARSPEVREIWFHHAREDRWLAGGEVAFAPVAHTPMGYGLAAVEAGAPGAMTLADAQSRVAAIPGRAAP